MSKGSSLAYCLPFDNPRQWVHTDTVATVLQLTTLYVNGCHSSRSTAGMSCGWRCRSAYYGAKLATQQPHCSSHAFTVSHSHVNTAMAQVEHRQMNSIMHIQCIVAALLLVFAIKNAWG